MKKFIVNVEQDGVVARTKVTLEGDECPGDGGVLCRMHQMEILTQFAATPDLHYCGYWAFQRMRVYHNGTRWLIELEADRPRT